jgi:hypothetical protein
MLAAPHDFKRRVALAFLKVVSRPTTTMSKVDEVNSVGFLNHTIIFGS